MAVKIIQAGMDTAPQSQLAVDQPAHEIAVADIATRARALIVPSRITEPFGLVILEAAMSGVPVIVSSHAYLAQNVVQLGFGEAFNIDRSGHLAEIVAAFALPRWRSWRLSLRCST